MPAPPRSAAASGSDLDWLAEGAQALGHGAEFWRDGAAAGLAVTLGDPSLCEVGVELRELHQELRSTLAQAVTFRGVEEVRFASRPTNVGGGRGGNDQ